VKYIAYAMQKDKVRVSGGEATIDVFHDDDDDNDDNDDNEAYYA
jgi:hypothetical protein